MADSKPGGSRPLSPHLAIYRPEITMVMSILHRVTGAALYLGTLLLAAWLLAAASGPAAFAWMQWFWASLIGRLLLLGCGDLPQGFVVLLLRFRQRDNQP